VSYKWQWSEIEVECTASRCSVEGDGSRSMYCMIERQIPAAYAMSAVRDRHFYPKFSIDLVQHLRIKVGFFGCLDLLAEKSMAQ